MHGARFVVGLVAAASLPLIAAAPPARAGQLDVAFGAGGVGHYDGALPGMDKVNATARGRDSASVTVAGRAGDRFAIGRAESRRPEDTSPDSLTTVDFGVPSEAYGLLPLAEAVLAVGTAGGDFALASLSPSLATPLGYQRGRVRTSFGADAVARAVSDDGSSITAVGSVKTGRGSSIAIARYAVDPFGFASSGRYSPYSVGAGAPDLPFGDGGKVIDDITPGDDVAYAVTASGSVVAGKAGGAALLAAYRTDGTPNPAFGTGGHVLLDLTAGDDVAYSIVANGSGSDFRYLVAGSAGPDAFVAKFYGDGRPDVSFGTDGVLRIGLGGPSRFTSIDAGQITADAFLLSGVVTRAGADDAVLVRITPDGTLDPAFGAAGVVVADLGGALDQVAGATVAWFGKAPNGGPFALAGGDGKDAIVVTFDAGGKRIRTKRLGFGAPVVDWGRRSHRFPDGRTLVLATRHRAGPYLARLLPDGSPDPSFGSNGQVDPALGAGIEARAMDVAGDGSILALFDVAAQESQYSHYYVLRFLPDGRRDASFGTEGVAWLGGSFVAATDAILVLPDGRVRASLGAQTYALSATGQPDISWGAGAGYVSIWGDPRARLPEPDGSFLAFQPDRDRGSSCYRSLRVLRYRPDGTNAVAWCGGPDILPTSVLRRPDGRILVAGTTGAALDHTVVASFLPTGAVDPTFGTQGYVRLDVADRDTDVLLALGPAGTVVFASEGYRQGYGQTGFGRLLADGRVDRSFAPGGIARLTVAQSPVAVAVQPDGKVVITATVKGPGGDDDVGLVRYVPAGRAVVVPGVTGWNGVGALGNGTALDSHTPVAPVGLSNVRQMSAGWYHSLAVLDDGSVMAWGWNAVGQLGIGTTADSSVPVRVSGLPRIVSVAAGALHSLALGADGSVWSWGWNGMGQLGTGTTADSLRPVKATIEAVSSIAAGGLHSMALRSDGVVWSWGWNGVGQLGIGTTTDSLWPTPHVGTDKFVKIAAGAYHSLAVGAGGSVFAWGWNAVGQLGIGTTVDASIPTEVRGITNAVDVAAGVLHSLAVTTERPGDVDGGAVWAWGWNGVGELGDGTTTTRLAPVAVPGLVGIQKVAAGALHSVALGAGGAVWTWGWNAYGQLGDGTVTDRYSPWRATTVVDGTTVAAGALHTMMG